MSTKSLARRRISPSDVLHLPNLRLGTDNGPNGLMKAAMGFSEISVEIPESATLAEVEGTLQLAIQGYKRLQEASERLKPIIGRILLTVSQRKLWKPQYKNFTAFLMDKVVGEMGLGRSNAFDALRIARAFPNMSQEDYMRFGASRLLLAASVTDEANPGAREVLLEASKLTVEAFRERVKEMKPATTPNSFTVSIRVTPEVKAEWQSIMDAVEITPGDLFAQMIQAFKANTRGYTTKKPAATAEVMSKVKHAMHA